MRTAAAPRADLASAPQSLTWLVYCRENKLLTASEWALAAILVTLGEGQNITMSVAKMAGVLGMKRDTVSAAIGSLEAKGLLLFVRPGRNRTKVYRLTLPVARMGTNQLPDRGPTGCPDGDQLVAQMGTTTSREDQEGQEDLHQHRDDDGRQSSTDRAKDDFPAVEVFVSDLEGVVDELEHRLGMAPGTVNIKALAKKWREMMARHDELAGVSAALESFRADDGMWSRCAAKDHPVGYFLNEIDRWLSEPGQDNQ